MKKNKEIFEKIVDENIENIFEDRFGRYAKYIIQDRALPDARDGLKPVQRRILYAMYYDGNTFEKPYRKSAKSVGLIIGNFHPHGDSSVYDAMVRMSQSWKNNHTLIDMHGNNGSIDDDSPAAMRYTEARLSEFSSFLLKDIGFQTVSWSPNFDDTLLEPTVLPAEFPLLLVNGATGISAGYATNIPPHNLAEVIDATVFRINNPNCQIDELLNFIKGPDFPTGGIIQGKSEIKNAYKTGKGKIVVRAKTEVIEKNNLTQIVITEIPFEVVKCDLVKKIDDIRIEKEIDGIYDVRDESGRDGLRIVVEIKKDVDYKLVLKYLFKKTNLQQFYNYNMVAIVDQCPKQISLDMALDCFINHRKDVILKRSKFLRDKKQARIHILDGLIKAISILDEIIELIKNSKDRTDAKNRLMNAFLFSEQQAEAIVMLRLYRLTNTDINELRKEHSNLNKEIFELKSIIENEVILTSLMIKELQEFKKLFATERKTVIENEIEDISIDKVSMMQNEKVMVAFSTDGYLKKVSLRSFNSSEGVGGLKDGDSLVGFLEVDSLDTLLIFTNKGNYVYLPIYEIDECKWKDLGKHLNSYVKLKPEEKIIDVLVVKNFDTYAFVLIQTKMGMIKKTLINDFKVQRYNKTYTAIKFRTDDEVVAAKVIYENDSALVLTRNGFCTHFDCGEINIAGLKSSGSKSINLEKADFVSSFLINDNKENKNLILFTEQGLTKRIRNEDLKKTNRPVKGYRLSKYVKTNTQYIKYSKFVNIFEEIYIYQHEFLSYLGKDFTLMELENNYSTNPSFKDDFWIMNEIQEVKIIDFPQGYNSEEYSQLGIFEND